MNINVTKEVCFATLHVKIGRLTIPFKLLGRIPSGAVWFADESEAWKPYKLWPIYPLAVAFTWLVEKFND